MVHLLAGVTVNVHHFLDPVSEELAGRIVDLLGDARRIPFPVDDLNWSGVSLFSEEDQTWVARLKWPRGNDRDLAQAAHQLATGVGLHRDRALCKPGMSDIGQQGINALCDELGVPRPVGRKHNDAGSTISINRLRAAHQINSDEPFARVKVPTLDGQDDRPDAPVSPPTTETGTDDA